MYQIPEAFQELDHSLQHCYQLADRLLNRLEPVLRPEPQDSAGNQAHPTPPLAPVTQNIIGKIAECNRTINILQDILDRLEL